MNEANTLGRRIQEGRRTAGLSQEALGERLNVSRQAVSKWEADAAIPELENLIAMSRVFGVPVGELLGVEDPAGAGGLTERELAAAEAVAAGYAGEQSRRTEKRLRAAAVLGGIGGLCLLVLAAVAAFHIVSVNRRLDNLQMQLDSVRNQSTVVVQQPAAGDPLLAASDVVITDLDLEAETITLRLSATPAEQKVETTASFAAALADGSVLTRDADGEGGTAFTVRDWTIPMSESVELSVIFTSGDDVRTVGLDNFSAAPEDFRFEVYAWWSASWSSTGPVRLEQFELQLLSGRMAPYLAEPPEPETVELCLYRNRDAAPEQTLLVEEALEVWRSSGYVELTDSGNYRTSFQLEEGETMTAVLRIQDHSGGAAYYPLNGWKRSGGEVRPLPVPETGWTPGASLE